MKLIGNSLLGCLNCSAKEERHLEEIVIFLMVWLVGFELMPLMGMIVHSQFDLSKTRRPPFSGDGQ